ncbi:hypothetical protein HAX54_044426 [Datura stramonium]|uniref:Rho-GAP domain-containing protein n=1 Tax=Datura stramonium TaxID=4076 RepID=A0ABS8SP58_DATST|nr:hypothetical protein [Datura stramonium]
MLNGFSDDKVMLLNYSYYKPLSGTKVEGILRQSADVEEVVQRVNEYEQGKTEFVPEEDAHVIGDCVKHVLRELPSSPVPASCCTALLEAYKIERKEARVNAMRSAILETFPEPNRRLLQSGKQNGNNNNIPSVIPQVGFGEDGVYTTLPLPCEGREAISNRPLAQIKHIKIKYGKEIQ